MTWKSFARLKSAQTALRRSILSEELLSPPSRRTFSSCRHVAGRTQRALCSARPLSTEEPDQDWEQPSAHVAIHNNHRNPVRRDGSAAGPMMSTSTSELTETLSQTFSPAALSYAGGTAIPITSTLHLVKPNEDAPHGIWPVFRLMVGTHLFGFLEYCRTLVQI